MHIVQPKLIRRLHPNRNLLDRTGAIVPTGAADRDRRRHRLVRRDKVVLREPHWLALVGRGHMIGAVLLEMDRASVPVPLPARQLDRLATGTVHLDFECSVGPLNGTQVAGVLLRHRLHAGPLRILVRHSNSLHSRKIHDAHLVVRRNQRTCGHVVLDVLRQTRKDKLIRRQATRVRLRLHSDRFPSPRTLVVSKDLHLLRPHAGHTRGNKLVAVPPHRNVARRNRDRIQRSYIFLRPRPQQRSTVAEIARPGSDHPRQHAKASQPRAAECKEPVVRNQRRRRCILRSRQSISGQQLQKRVATIAFALMEGCQPLLEPRMYGFGLAHGPCSRQASQRKRNAKPRDCNQRSKQRQTSSRDSMRREGIMIEQQHQRDGDDKRRAGKDSRAAQPRSQPQPLLQPRDIGVELIPLAHASSRCVPM